MPQIDLGAIEPRETAPGFSGRFIHEQVSQVLEGVFQLTVAGEQQWRPFPKSPAEWQRLLPDTNVPASGTPYFAIPSLQNNRH
jgi:hypothetical protein